jgi:PAS domain S-box-containing protein
MFDADLVTVFVNPRMAAMLGYGVEDMHGRPLSDFVSKTALAETLAWVSQPDPAEAERAPVQYRRRDGSDLWADVTRTRGCSEDGTVTGVLKMVSDMSTQTNRR